MTENFAEPSTPQVRRRGSRRPASADQERLVRRYLSALETNKAGRGVKRAADAIGNRITKVDELLVSADPLARVHLTQERIELHAEYVRVTNGNHPDQSQLERDFVRVVRSYGDRNGITYAAWRQVGVDVKVLEQAGIHRADKKPPPARAAGASPATSGATLPTAVETRSSTRSRNGATPSPEVSDPEVSAPEVSDPEVSEAATPERELAAPPPGEVSLDELADLLAEAGPSQASPAGEGLDQPRLGSDLDPMSEAVPDPPQRSPRASGS